jgi:hypothetical protein
MARRSECYAGDWLVSNIIVACTLCDPDSSQDRVGVPASILEQGLGQQILAFIHVVGQGLKSGLRIRVLPGARRGYPVWSNNWKV